MRPLMESWGRGVSMSHESNLARTLLVGGKCRFPQPHDSACAVHTDDLQQGPDYTVIVTLSFKNAPLPKRLLSADMISLSFDDYETEAPYQRRKGEIYDHRSCLFIPVVENKCFFCFPCFP